MPRLLSRRHRRPPRGLVRSLLPAAALAATTTAAPARADAIVVPARLDLGSWPAGRTVTGRAWLINAGPASLRVTRVQAADDGIRVAGAPERPLPPGGAAELRVELAAPVAEGAQAARSVTLDLDRGPAVTLTVLVRAVHPDVHLAPPASGAWSPLRAAPPTVDFGPAPPGRRVERAVWLINAASRPVRVADAKGSCGCLEVPGFAPFDVAPGRAVRVPLVMLAEAPIGRERFKHVTFLLAGHEPLPVETRVEVIDPREARARRYLDSVDRNDAAAARTCLALDARFWRDRRRGAGAPPADGLPPWRDWERALHTTGRVVDAGLAGDAAVLTIEETGDLHRRLGAPPDCTRATFWFDDAGLIGGVLYERETDGLAAGLAGLAAWARLHRPGEWDALQAQPRDPALAPRWLALVDAWRAAGGPGAPP